MKQPKYNEKWSEDLKRIYAHDMEQYWDKSIAPHLYNSYKMHIAMYQALVPTGALKVLDVGCAQGTLALILAEGGYEVTALDLRAEFLDYAKSRWTHGKIKFVKANALEYESPERFDVVFANQVLEHLVYPVEFLRKLWASLAPGGMLVASTPSWSYIKNNLPRFSDLGDVSNHASRQFTADGDGHFFAYSNDELAQIFSEAGFFGVSVRNYETPWISGHMRLRYLHKVVPYSVLSALDSVFCRFPMHHKYCYQSLVVGQRAL
jgi:2-polyprenyl-3-methyl-5-hydroxy-6-metoxy-1,4-benzoquinol methylase